MYRSSYLKIKYLLPRATAICIYYTVVKYKMEISSLIKSWSKVSLQLQCHPPNNIDSSVTLRCPRGAKTQRHQANVCAQFIGQQTTSDPDCTAVANDPPWCGPLQGRREEKKTTASSGQRRKRGPLYCFVRGPADKDHRPTPLAWNPRWPNIARTVVGDDRRWR